MRDPLLDARLIHRRTNGGDGWYCEHDAEPWPCSTVTHNQCDYLDAVGNSCIYTTGHPYADPRTHLVMTNWGTRFAVTPLTHAEAVEQGYV